MKNTVSSKVVIHNWMREKEFSMQAKAKGIHYHRISLTRNNKRTSFSRKARVLISNKKALEK